MKLTTKPIILHKNTHQGKPVETIDLGNTEDESRDSNESGSADEDLESDLSNENENHLESENLDDSVVEGYEAGHEEEEGEREGAGIGLEFYSNNELLDFAATALCRVKFMNTNQNTHNLDI